MSRSERLISEVRRLVTSHPLKSLPTGEEAEYLQLDAERTEKASIESLVAVVGCGIMSISRSDLISASYERGKL